MAWIQFVDCEKSRRDFVAGTFSLIEPVYPVLLRVSCSYEMIPNATKHYANVPKHESRVQWGGLGVFVAKIPGVSSWHELLL
jgi:hypothetical protein